MDIGLHEIGKILLVLGPLSIFNVKYIPACAKAKDTETFVFLYLVILMLNIGGGLGLSVWVTGI